MRCFLRPTSCWPIQTTHKWVNFRFAHPHVKNKSSFAFCNRSLAGNEQEVCRRSYLYGNPRQHPQKRSSKTSSGPPERSSRKDQHLMWLFLGRAQISTRKKQEVMFGEGQGREITQIRSLFLSPSEFLQFAKDMFINPCVCQKQNVMEEWGVMSVHFFRSISLLSTW